MTWAVLLRRRAEASFLPYLGAFLAGFGLWADFPLTVAAWGFGGVGLAFLVAFFAGAGVPRPWIRFQIRTSAVLPSLNPSIGLTPGRLFQIATRRSAGQLAASAANSAAVVWRGL
jgi:hypothetical protein